MHTCTWLEGDQVYQSFISGGGAVKCILSLGGISGQNLGIKL